MRLPFSFLGMLAGVMCGIAPQAQAAAWSLRYAQAAAPGEEVRFRFVPETMGEASQTVTLNYGESRAVVLLRGETSVALLSPQQGDPVTVPVVLTLADKTEVALPGVALTPQVGVYGREEMVVALDGRKELTLPSVNRLSRSQARVPLPALVSGEPGATVMLDGFAQAYDLPFYLEAAWPGIGGHFIRLIKGSKEGGCLYSDPVWVAPLVLKNQAGPIMPSSGNAT